MKVRIEPNREVIDDALYAAQAMNDSLGRLGTSWRAVHIAVQDEVFGCAVDLSEHRIHVGQYDSGPGRPLLVSMFEYGLPGWGLTHSGPQEQRQR
jgi:hypothetical protein